MRPRLIATARADARHRLHSHLAALICAAGLVAHPAARAQVAADGAATAPAPTNGVAPAPAVDAPKTETAPGAANSPSNAAASPDLAPETPTAPPTAAPPAAPAAPSAETADARRDDDAADAETAEAIRNSDRAAIPIETRDGEFGKPLLFAPEDNGVQLTNPQIKWELLEGNRINFGGITIVTDDFGLIVSARPREKLPRAYRPRGAEGPPALFVSFRWPDVLAKTGSLVVLGARGEALFRKEIESADRAEWRRSFDRKEKGAIAAHAKSQWGVLDAGDEDLPFLNYKNLFRVCLQKREGRREKLLACSGPLRWSRGPGGALAVASALAQPVAPGVAVNSTELGDHGSVNFAKGQAIRIRIAFADGSTVQVSGAPLSLNILDAVRAPDGRIKLMGQGPKPVGLIRNLIVPADHFWSATGGLKPEIVWETTLPKDAPTVRVLGSFNLPFTYVFRYRDLPNEADRPYISSLAGNGTYVDGAKIEIFSPADDEIASRENSASRVGKNRALWRFKAAEVGKINRSRVAVVKPDGRRWIAHYDMLKGQAFEASGRITGVATQSLQTIFFGEVAANAWLEDPLFTNNYWLSRRHWGAAFRYFQSFGPIESPDGASVSSFHAGNLDLKFNAIPGLWNRDELLGLIVSGQNVDIGGLGGNLVGFGAYWARTMPKIFDQVFNIVPYLRYPKYVDMEFIYYPVSLSSDVRAGASYNLNFHGKVFWTPSFFGEMGFGIRRYAFQSVSADANFQLAMGYTTFGLGWRF